MGDDAVIDVMIVDDQPLVTAGLRAILDRDPGIRVVAEAADGAAAISQAHRHRPDVILMDIRMPGIDGITATERITTDPRLAETRVIVLTTFDTDDNILDAIAAGASSFLLKDVDAQQLRDGIRVVAAGDGLLSPSVTTRVLRHLAVNRRASPAVDPARLDELTDREREVLRQVGRGLSNDEVADELVISPATARTYVSRILTKLGVRDRANLVVIAYQTGLLEP